MSYESVTSTATDGEVTDRPANRYVSISRKDFEAFLDGLAWEFTKVRALADEYVYRCDVPGDRLQLRVYSSVDCKTEHGREKGADAIRTVLWNRRADQPVGGRERTHRIGSWRSNLREKIEYLRVISPQYADAMGDCPDCGAALVVRDGEYGEFIGCSGFPHCTHTASVEIAEGGA